MQLEGQELGCWDGKSEQGRKETWNRGEKHKPHLNARSLNKEVGSLPRILGDLIILGYLQEVLCQAKCQGHLGSRTWQLPNFCVHKNYLTVVKIHTISPPKPPVDYSSPGRQVQFCLESSSIYTRLYTHGPFNKLFYVLWRRQWHPTPVLLPGKSHGQRSLVGCSPWGR